MRALLATLAVAGAIAAGSVTACAQVMADERYSIATMSASDVIRVRRCAPPFGCKRQRSKPQRAVARDAGKRAAVRASASTRPARCRMIRAENAAAGRDLLNEIGSAHGAQERDRDLGGRWRRVEAAYIGGNQDPRTRLKWTILRSDIKRWPQVFHYSEESIIRMLRGVLHPSDQGTLFLQYFFEIVLGREYRGRESG